MPNDKESAIEGGVTETTTTRREFIAKTLSAGAGLMLGGALPLAPRDAAAQAPACVPPETGQKLVEIAEIRKATPNGPVQGMIKVLNENKTYLDASKLGGAPVCQSGQMRYLTGTLADGSEIWPPKSGRPAPGPTLRARVGDTVQIALLNQVNVADFGDSLDRGEGSGSCDVATSTGPGGSVNTYPGDPAFDKMPNCLHGSSTANLHYHGTHISPNIIADNVFVQLRPSPRRRLTGKPVVDEAFLKANDFFKIFRNCEAGHSPQKWGDLPPRWQYSQRELLKQYDANAVWQGERGKLPDQDKLWPKDLRDIKQGNWPQYYVGAYPSCFELPKWNGKPSSMGQAPGTHWYHAHKHGSTALNLANGMAGAFIIEGEYDDGLRSLFNKEFVLVLQQYTTTVPLLRAPGTTVGGGLVYVNGQYTPVIEMRPNEVQLWRIVNTCHQGTVAINGGASADLRWVQTAQDGVQLDPRNYALAVRLAQKTPGTWTNASLTTPMIAPPWIGNLAPGNRVDLLVQAPASAGSFPVTFGSGPTLLFTVSVTGTPVANPIAFPPAQADFPPMPGFLADISDTNIFIQRKLVFETTHQRRSESAITPPTHTINGAQFEDYAINQTMSLGDTEEWTLVNANEGGGGPAHPFHIHINPFQVVEILNPSISKKPIPLPAPWIWWDNIAIPSPAVPPDADPVDQGKVVPGYVKIRSRFADFTGTYVLHCHILGHEDRGMMQMVQVVGEKTTIGHH